MATLSLRKPSSAGTSCDSYRAQGHGKRDTCMYELRFVEHDPVTMGNWIPMAGRLMGQVRTSEMLGSDYPLTQRQLPDERNPPFHLHENPNNARTNVKQEFWLQLQFNSKVRRILQQNEYF
jgi:hypothetical protein